MGGEAGKGTALRLRLPLETGGRIRAFVNQAEDARANNITIVVQLCRRAALLAKDLLESLK